MSDNNINNELLESLKDLMHMIDTPHGRAKFHSEDEKETLKNVRNLLNRLENPEYNLSVWEGYQALRDGKAVQGDGFDKDCCISLGKNGTILHTKGETPMEGPAISFLDAYNSRFKVVDPADFS